MGCCGGSVGPIRRTREHTIRSKTIRTITVSKNPKPALRIKPANDLDKYRS